MLVLSRKQGEEILIPGMGIRIVLLSVSGSRIQLGFEAPSGVQITRPEARHPQASATPNANPRRF